MAGAVALPMIVALYTASLSHPIMQARCLFTTANKLGSSCRDFAIARAVEELLFMISKFGKAGLRGVTLSRGIILRDRLFGGL